MEVNSVDSSIVVAKNREAVDQTESTADSALVMQLEMMSRAELLAPKNKILSSYQFQKIEKLSEEIGQIIDKTRAEKRGLTADEMDLIKDKKIKIKTLIKEIEGMNLESKAKKNVEKVRALILKDFNESGQKLDDLAHPYYWIPEFEVVAHQLMNHVVLGEKYAASVKGDSVPERGVTIVPNGSKAALLKPKAGESKDQFRQRVEKTFAKFIDDLHDGKYQEARLEDDVDHDGPEGGVAHFLKHIVFKDNIIYQGKNASPQKYIREKLESLNQSQKTLLAYYLWSIAEYSRVKTLMHYLHGKLNRASYYEYATPATVNGKALDPNRKYLRQIYEIQSDITSQVFTMAKELTGDLDPDIQIKLDALLALEEGDKALRNGNYAEARRQYQQASSINSNRKNKPQNDHLTGLIERKIEGLDWLDGTHRRLTAKENPARGDDGRIAYDANQNYETSLFRAMSQMGKDKDLPTDYKTKLKRDLEEILDLEKEYLKLNDDELKPFRDVQGHEQMVSARQNAQRVITAKIDELTKKLDSSVDYKRNLQIRKEHQKRYDKAREFVAKHSRQRGVFDDRHEKEREEAIALKVAFNQIPDEYKKEFDSKKGEEIRRINDRLEEFSKLGTVSPESVGKDIEFSFINLRSALNDFRQRPSKENLQRLAKIYVPLLILFSNEDETKSDIENIFKRTELDEVFWKNGVFDPSGQNIFLEEYRKLKNNEGRGYLVEGYVPGEFEKDIEPSRKQRTFYSFAELKTAFEKNDVLGQMSAKQNNIALLKKVGWFLRDTTGILTTYQPARNADDIDHMIYTFCRLLNKNGDNISIGQFKQNFATQLKKFLIEKEIHGNFEFIPSANKFSAGNVEYRLTEKNANAVKDVRTNTAQFFLVYFLAYDLNYDRSLKDYLIKFETSMDITDQRSSTLEGASNTLGMLAAKDSKLPREWQKMALALKLEQLERYVLQTDDGSEEKMHYKAIRLSLIRALKASLNLNQEVSQVTPESPN